MSARGEEQPRALVFVFGRPGAGSFNAAAADAVDAMQPLVAARGAGVDLLWRQTFDTPSRLAAIETELATEPALVIVHGGQGDAPVAQLAPRFPSTLFAVTQGSVVGPNLASYEVRQEESAFLAGVFAARSTRSGCVAHLSGETVRPGLLGRAAFVAGVQDEAPGMKVLTAFCGHQHDADLAHRWASAMIDSGADVLFTMLDGGRPGAIAACRERGAALIGNVEDWTRRAPDVCTASAIADSGWGVEQAIADWLDGRFPARSRISIGAERPGVIRLAMSAEQSVLHGEAIALRVRRLIAEPHSFSPDYAGPQFALPHRSS